MTESRPIDVLLVSLPFGPLRQPSIGAELLRASITGSKCESLYLTVQFAERIGLDRYDLVTSLPDPLLVGDWIFRDAVFGADARMQSEYFKLLGDGGRFHAPVAAAVQDEIVAVRDLVEGFLDDAVTQVIARQPRIVGITSAFQQHVASLAFARRLKAKAPGVIVVLGGANCEGEMGAETMSHFPFVDVVVSGEADLVFAPLVARLLSGASLDGLSGVGYRTGPVLTPPSPPAMVRDLDALPVPSYDQFFEQWHGSAIASQAAARLPIEFSRGCWWGEKHHCTFCGLNGLTMSFRAKSAERALSELRALAARHPGSYITAVDNIMDMRYFRSVLPVLAAAKEKGRFFTETKSNLRREQLQLLCDAGFTEIQPGIESLSTSILRLMRKGVSGLQNIQTLKWAAEFGIQVHWNWLWGFPGESADEYRRCAQWVPLLTHLMPPEWSGLIHLQRFSPNYFDSDQLGVRNVRPMPAYEWVYPLDESSLRRLAYYFAFEDAAGSDVDGYTAVLRDAIRQWKSAYATSALFSVDYGHELRVYDFRPVARAPLTVLEGLQRRLYLECDEVRAVDALIREHSGQAPGEAEEAIAMLLDRGLMVREGGHVLSLAVRGKVPVSAGDGADAARSQSVSAV